MLTNFHTHTSYCDGENSPEEFVLYAIEQGFDSIGFSGHGYTPFDLRYCIKDLKGYISSVNTLKEKYKGKIQIYLGVEEDAFAPLSRSDFNYIIGSSHYFCVDGKYYPIDSDYNYFKKCLEVFKFDIPKMAEVYYNSFCDYIAKRKPDIAGHFDLITKFDEVDEPRFLCNDEYMKIAEKYMHIAAENEILFEVNTGAIAKGLRKTAYPFQNLLYIIKKCDRGVILSSDAHKVNMLDFYFDEVKKILKDTGFEYVYVLHNGNFKKDYI